jgi:ribosome-binding protein aMBF1 (putative translation factor)
MTKKHNTKSRKDAYDVLMDSVVQRDPEAADRIEEKYEGVKIAEQIYRMRKEAGLTQQELADRVGTSKSVISRLEDADYDGYSVRTLRRIAASCRHELKVRFVPSTDSQ